MTPKYESDFTQRVIEAIENARLDAGVSVQEIIMRSGIRRSSYFRKMRGETTFTTEDVDALARALGMDPFLLLSKASGSANVGGRAENVDLHEIDVNTLALAATRDTSTVEIDRTPDYENETQDPDLKEKN